MLKWLRSAGDSARIDQEMRSLGIDPNAVPTDMKRELVSIAQKHIDEAKSHYSTPEFFQIFFDTAFKYAAIAPSIFGLSKDLALKVVSAEDYEKFKGHYYSESFTPSSNLVKGLYAVCKKHMRYPSPEFDDADKAEESRINYGLTELGKLAAPFIQIVDKDDLTASVKSIAAVTTLVEEAKRKFNLTVEEKSLLDIFLKALENQNIARMAEIGRYIGERAADQDDPIMRGYSVMIYFQNTSDAV